MTNSKEILKWSTSESYRTSKQSVPVLATEEALKPGLPSLRAGVVFSSLHCVWLFAESCLTLCDPADCSLPGSPASRMSQARILEWVAVSSSRGPSRPRNRTHVFSRQILYHLRHLGSPFSSLERLSEQRQKQAPHRHPSAGICKVLFGGWANLRPLEGAPGLVGGPHECGKDSRGGAGREAPVFLSPQPDSLSASHLAACPAWLDSHTYKTTCTWTAEGGRAASGPTGP